MATGTRASARLRKKPRISYLEREEECSLTQGEEEHVLNHDKAETSHHNHQPGMAKRDIFNWAELPGELKNRVYDHVLSVPSKVHIRKMPYREMPTLRRYFPDSNENAVLLIPNLLRVNKQTYSEGAPLLFQNHLSFKDSIALYLFLHRLNSEQKQWIQHITIEFMTGKGFIQPTFDLLIGTSNIKTMTIGNFTDNFSDRNWGFNIAIRLYYAAYNWLEAVGKEKGDQYAAVDLINISDSAIVATCRSINSRSEIPGRRRYIQKKLKEKISGKK